VKTKLVLCIALTLVTAFRHAYAQVSSAAVPEIKIDSSYDASKDRTTVRLAAVKISGEKNKYYSLHMSPSFSYGGHSFVRPEVIDFELRTVVKGRLSTDVYVIFVIDGEEIFLSSNRAGIERPIRGRRWKGERLVFRMPLEILQRLANAKRAFVKFDGIPFEFDDDHRRALKTFAARASSA
jgi:hypothetical protein